jgi:hypothetical protein
MAIWSQALPREISIKDGNQGLAVTIGTGKGLTQLLIYSGNGNGTFNAPAIVLGAPPNTFTGLNAIVVANMNLNNNTIPDLVVNSGNEGLLVLIGDGTGAFPTLNKYAIPLAAVPF